MNVRYLKFALRYFSEYRTVVHMEGLRQFLGLGLINVFLKNARQYFILILDKCSHGLQGFGVQR